MDFFKVVNETLKAQVPEAPKAPPPPPPPPQVTAPVTPPEPEVPYVEPELPTFENIDQLDIPAFLMRRRGGWVYPSLHAREREETSEPPTNDRALAGVDSPAARTLALWTDGELQLAAEDPTTTCASRQEVYRELLRREEHKKARVRIAKMKETLGERREIPKHTHVARRAPKRRRRA